MDWRPPHCRWVVALDNPSYGRYTDKYRGVITGQCDCLGCSVQTSTGGGAWYPTLWNRVRTIRRGMKHSFTTLTTLWSYLTAWSLGPFTGSDWHLFTPILCHRPRPQTRKDRRPLDRNDSTYILLLCNRFRCYSPCRRFAWREWPSSVRI